ncbi:acriflavin resistance protein B [Escherichia coli]|uniref:Acriflavin resistance protein B n=1 Tax=Escherichia coli TaxID=562 RepID=A0A376U4R3_ECOLX|nr:acriflavin resistance protein B [Escherichia coli]
MPKAITGKVKKGFFGWFNRMFEKSTHHYTDSVGGILRSTGRYLVLYLIIVVGMAYLFVRLPSSFLPDEDQGVFYDHGSAASRCNAGTYAESAQ